MALLPTIDLDAMPLTFGKHKGKSPSQIADEGDYSYITWLYETIEPKRCSKELYKDADMLKDEMDFENERHDFRDC